MRRLGLILLALAGCMAPMDEPAAPAGPPAQDRPQPPAGPPALPEPEGAGAAAVVEAVQQRFAPAWFDCDMLATAVPAPASAIVDRLPAGYSPAQTPDGVAALVILVARCGAVLTSNTTYVPEQGFAWAMVAVEPPPEVRHEGGQDAFALDFRSDTPRLAADAAALNLSASEAEIVARTVGGWLVEWIAEGSAGSFAVRTPSPPEPTGNSSESFYLHWMAPAGPAFRQVQAVYVEGDSTSSVASGDLPGLMPAGSPGLSFARRGSFALLDMGQGAA